MIALFDFDFSSAVNPKLGVIIKASESKRLRSHQDTLYEAALKKFVKNTIRGVEFDELKTMFPKSKYRNPSKSTNDFITYIGEELPKHGLQMAQVKYWTTKERVFYIIPL